MFTVLHVEHNRFYHVIMKNLVTRDNIKYVPAKSPKEAFEILENSKINLIITGLVFEDETGQDFIEALNMSKHANIPVIVLSSDEDDKLKEKLLERGILEFINKNTSVERVNWYVNKLEDREFTIEKLKDVKIAILDDNELELQILSNLFQKNGIDGVDYFSDPLEFLMNKQEYMVYVIDFALPKISAEYVITKIREKDKQCVILALSAITNETDISNILASGANDYVAKPINEEVLFERLKYNLIKDALNNELGSGSGNGSGSAAENKNVDHKMNIDSMTKLYNKTYCLKFLQDMIVKYKYGGDLSIMIINIDRFKHINNIYGFEFGDEVIVKIGNLMNALIRSTDVLGRFGGEEYILILPDTDMDGALILAEKLRETVEKTDFGKGDLQITVSGGIAEIDSDDPEKLINSANDLMLKAKRNGRNRMEYDSLL
jgi:diguanylate cyclase (GGDEF)-like protein